MEDTSYLQFCCNRFLFCRFVLEAGKQQRKGRENKEE